MKYGNHIFNGKIRWFLILIFTGFILHSYTVVADNSRKQDSELKKTLSEPYQADWDSLSTYPVPPEWFKNAKFGIYFHWGVYCVPAAANEWYPRNMHIEGTWEYKHHLETYGHPSIFGYHDFIPMFKGEKFNPEKWAELFQKAGARFAGPVAEHHDGFSMWASKINPWNAKDMGPHRDVVGELEKAIHGKGMKFFASFHMSRNLQRLAEHPDKKNDISYFPYDTTMPTSSTDSKLRILYGNIPANEFYKNWQGKLNEVIDHYHPDMIYFDGIENLIPEEYRKEFTAHYFNQSVKWGKEVLFTHKEEDYPDSVSIRDLEKGRMNQLTSFYWLTDEPICPWTWCYTKGMKLKPAGDILHLLIDVVSKNGVFLLNISPKANGEIPQNQQKILLEIGHWMHDYGESIYDTRPWIIYGEGPTKLEKSGHFLPAVKYTNRDIRYTTKGKIIYAIFLGWPGAGKNVLLKSFAKKDMKGNLEIQSISLLGSKEKVQWVWKSNGLHLTIQKKQVDDKAIVFKITTTGKVKI